ncbi:MAG TPA: prepilin-type N-terminal cleavage/methylation domain-containing protein [Thermoanaerobaculia bacterium]|nr:prepilin-type N-terminal cleavage/methylation domain-containing protein [Thermoanaerobaculia bacterium]
MRKSGRIHGFSLVELIVSLAIVVIVILAMSTLFDKSNRMAKAENSVTDAQQSARYGSYQLVREARMAGAGGIAASVADGGNFRQLAVSLNLGSSHWGTSADFDSNNVNSVNDTVCIGGTCGTAGAHHVRAGTDLLHVRGVLLNSVYDLGSGSWAGPGGSGSTGTLVIQPCTKYQDAAADPSSLCYPYGTNDMSLFPIGVPSASQPTNGRLFVMTDLLGNSGVGKITDVLPSTVTVGAGTGTKVTLTIDVGSSASPDTAYWQTISPGGAFPTGLSTPSRGGVLDDRVFFVDDGTTAGQSCTPANATISPGPCHPQLAVADWVDGDAAGTPFSTATVTPVADDVEDLQVAYGMDFYDAVAGTGTFTSPAPTRNDPVTGLPLGYPSDGSISITDQTAFNNAVTAARGSSIPAAGSDASESATADADEWIWNVGGEPGGATFNRASDLSRLKALEVTILAKGQNPDPQYGGPNALDFPLFDSAALTVSRMTKNAALSTVAMPYHRRAVTVRLQLRNFALQ